MQRGERLGRSFRGKRKGVDQDGGRDEGQPDPDRARGFEPALPPEIARETRKDEEAQVPQIDPAALRERKAEELREPDRDGRERGESEDHQRFPPLGPREAAGRRPRRIRLLPVQDPAGDFAQELPGWGMAFADPLQGDQECLVGVQPRLPERSELSGERRLQVFQPGAIRIGCPIHPGAPGGDPALQLVRVGFLGVHSGS